MVLYCNVFARTSTYLHIIIFRIYRLLHVAGKPDPPEAIRALNFTHTSVLLSWTAGFNGGLEQQFRIRFRRTEDESGTFDYTDLIPGEVSLYLVGGLEPGTEYAFSVLGRNALGESEYSDESEVVTTLCKYGAG